MASFEKGILGGFSGKVGNVVGYRWRGRNFMRSLPQGGTDAPTENQLLQRSKFKLVIKFLSPFKGFLSTYFGKKQGDKSPFNLAVSYHLTEAVLETPQGLELDYARVLISRGDLRGLETPAVLAQANQELVFTWTDNSGQGDAYPEDAFTTLVFEPVSNIYQLYEGIATRQDGTVTVTLPAYLAGLEVQVWATFVNPTLDKAAISSYLGAVTVL